MRAGLNEEYLVNQSMVKTAFLSYYISMYNSVSRELEMADAPVTIDEIYDFIQDMKHEAGRNVPDIQKEDILLCFKVLQAGGICR